MQSNITRVSGADPEILAGANWRTRFPGLVLAALASAAFLGAPQARADEYIDLVMPFVQAGSHDPVAGSTPAVAIDDFSDPLQPLVEAAATHGGAYATGRIGLTDYATANASSGTAGAGVEMLIGFTVEDPQNRPQVKTIFRFKGVASSPPDPVGSSRLGGASWGVRLGQSDGGPLRLVVHDDLSSQVVAAPQIVGTPVFQLDMNVSSGDGGSCVSYIHMNGQRMSARMIPDCASITEGGSLELTHAPGTYLMKVYVQAGNNAVVVGDPIWEPHPDNPDVVVTRHAPNGSPGAPLAGITADDLTARGIDPTPFVAAGFFDEASPVPPPPQASNDWCGPGFWQNNATRFSASAWPVLIYSDYNSSAGKLAGCPVASGSPALLDVLRNPSLYFATQAKGLGYNCVADYLSEKSGLTGTYAANNGVCSIDQFGHHTE